MTHSNKNSTTNRFRPFRFALKLILWLIGVPLLILVLAVIALQFPQTQSYVTNTAGTYLSTKLNTRVSLDRISISFPKAIALENVYLEDQQKDTLLYVHSLKVNVSLMDLLSNKVTVQSVTLDTFTGHIIRADSTFNFDFIIKAFASDSQVVEVQPEEKKEPWKISVDKIELKNIYFTFHDALSGANADIRLGAFETTLDELNLEKSKFKINTIRLENSSLLYVQNQALKKDTVTSSEPLALDLGFKNIQLNKVKVVFKDQVNELNLDAKLGEVLMSANDLDLNTMSIDLDQVKLAQSVINFKTDKVTTPETVTAVSSVSKEKELPWLVKVKSLELKDNGFSFEDGSKKAIAEGMDFAHLQVKNLSLEAKEIYASPTKIQLALKHVSLVEKSGLRVKEFSSTILYDSTQAGLSKLNLQTDDTQLKGDFVVRYPSLGALKDSINTLLLNTRFDNSSIAISDILVFAPDLVKQPIIAANRRSRVKIKGALKGRIDDLLISELELRLLESTLIKLNGSVKQVTDPNRMYLQLPAIQISSSQKDVKTLVPDSLIPKNVTVPERFDLSGSFNGYLKNFNSQLDLKTSIGDVALTAKMNPAAGNREQPYDIRLSVNSFDLAKLLNQAGTLGPVSMSAAINGQGLDTSSIHAKFDVGVISAVFKGYEYKHLNMSGNLDKQKLSAKAAMKDKNVDFDFDGRINSDPSQPEYVFTLNLKGIDLKALNLSEEDLRVSALVQSDIRDKGRNNPEGKASVRNLLVIKDAKKYRLDSLVLVSEFKDSIADIRLSSDILEADFKGDITLSQLPALLQQQINGYFDLKMPLSKEKLNAQKFNFEFRLKDAAMLTQNTIPNLEKLTPFVIAGDYNSTDKKIRVDATVPQVVYSGITVDSLNLKINSDQQKLNLVLGSSQISNPTFKFENVFLGTELKNNTLNFQFNTTKDDSTKTLVMGGEIKSAAKGYELHLHPQLVFNAENWQVDPANLMVFGTEGMYANKVIIANGTRAIAVNSVEQKEKAPLEIKFTDFDLAVISKLIENNNDLVKGFIDGNLILEERNKASAFKSDLVIRDFAFKAVPVGNIQLKADNYGSSSVYVISLGVDGNGNDIKATGSFNTAQKDNSLDVVLDVNQLNLASIEPFTFGEITRMSGGIKGQLTIKGSPAKPDLNGHLDFKEATLRPKLIDSYLTIHDGKMNFNNKKIVFNNLTLYDSLNNKGSINGKVGIEDLSKINFDLNVKTDNFLALNTDSKDNPVYYGRVFLDSDVDITGTADAPNVNVKAKLNKGSYLTYVKPESLVSKNESKGIVEFVDSLYKDAVMTRTNDSINGSSDIKGIDLNATLSFDKSVQLKMFVDPEAGDSLYIVGGGTLDFGLDRSGKTSLTGKYRINNGGYHLSISDLVKRNFKIESGSSVTWSGDVLDAYVDVKAIYTIKTSPIDLMQNEVSAMSESERNKYRNLLTFNVYLKMTGFMSSPEITFDIQLAPGDRGALNGSINSKLAQLREDETVLNKQVFALLTLKRFIGENPLDNGNDGGGLTSASRSSASKVLTQQLSNLSDKYVNFVDLDLGVNSFEDYSTGQEQGRTQLQVGVSKQLLNDKISVHVGGNVELEGERAKQNNASDVAGNISIDYKLTKDGRYKLKAFRENQYENPIEGELTKTGMGIIYVRNYNSFRELFSKPVKKDTKPKND